MDGHVACWGLRSGVAPQTVEGTGTDATLGASASGEPEACGVTSLGAAVCWHYTLTETSMVANVVFVPGLGAGIRAIGGGPRSGCALTTTGEVRCWGASRGDGNVYGGDSPALVLALPPQATEIAVGRRHRCARGSSGRVWCWGGLSGAPTEGEIGDGTRARALVAIEVASLPGAATSIATGSVHTCAMTPAGVFCWGSNTFGQLGDGTTEQRLVPVAVAGL